MKNRNTSTLQNLFTKLNHIIEETDIRILAYGPPVISFIGLLIGIFIINLLTKGHPYQPITDIMLGILFLIPCFSGYAQIYKKEMPGLLGGIYKGNFAVVSGVLIIILSVFFSIVALAHGVSTLLGAGL
jgi:hypothetical protein